MEEVTRRLCAFGMRAGIFPRRDLLSRFIARVVPTSMLEERERGEGGSSSSQCVRRWKKGRKGWLSLPPRLVGANEGGTDRPVCTLPLSGSCRASTPNRIHVALRSLCNAVSLSLFLSHHLLRNSADREVGVLCSG